MTAPYRVTRALLKTRFFLENLALPAETPRVPAEVRATAKRLLQDFLTLDDIEQIHEALPGVLGPVEQRQPLGMPAAPDMTTLERESLTVLIANDLAALLAQEQPAQVEALWGLATELERACARWVGDWAKGAKG